MSFAILLEQIVEECGGGIGAALMGSDGIPIEQIAAREPAVPLDSDDISAAGIEFGRTLEEIRKISDTLGGGGLSETVIRLTRFTLIFHSVDSEHFLVVVIGPDGNLGKARYLIRRNLLAIRQEM